MFGEIQGDIERIDSPKDFFKKNPNDLLQVVDVVRASFGKELTFEDIYQHVTCPDKVFLHRYGDIKAMASYSSRNFAGVPSLIVEGVAISPEFQGKGLFNIMTKDALNDEKAICLRTQNPRMYRALEKMCKEIYPSDNEIPENIKCLISEFARYSGSALDSKGIVRGHYGGLFYSNEPTHEKISSLFKERLGMNLLNGDALLVTGIL